MTICFDQSQTFLRFLFFPFLDTSHCSATGDLTNNFAITCTIGSRILLLRAAIAEENWLLDDRLAVGGASMGAMTALGITARHPTVKCTASMMGSGYFTSLARSLFPPLIPETAAQQNEFNNIVAPLAEWEATNHLEQLGDRPLLLWHGLDDDVVPADESLRLQQALSETGRDKLLTCSWQPGVRHRITPEALDAAVTFFRQHL